MSRGMDCKRSRAWFDRRLDGRLSAEEGRELEQHLQGCAACREELRRWELPARLLRARPLAPVPPGLAGRIVRRVVDPEPAPSLAQGFVTVSRRFALAAALAAAAIWGGVLLFAPTDAAEQGGSDGSGLASLDQDPQEIVLALWAPVAIDEQDHD